jgi:hypothetical protein
MSAESSSFDQRGSSTKSTAADARASLVTRLTPPRPVGPISSGTADRPKAPMVMLSNVMRGSSEHARYSKDGGPRG